MIMKMLTTADVLILLFWFIINPSDHHLIIAKPLYCRMYPSLFRHVYVQNGLHQSWIWPVYRYLAFWSQIVQELKLSANLYSCPNQLKHLNILISSLQSFILGLKVSTHLSILVSFTTTKIVDFQTQEE